MDTEKVKIEEFTLESESELHFEIKGKNKKITIEVSSTSKSFYLNNLKEVIASSSFH